jgi:pimeloyl-ACP methyl ester carboxylesterase
MATFTQGPVSLTYELHGHEGDPTVLVHGSLTDRRSWDRVVDSLGRVLQVISYDRRGYGASSGPTRARAIRDDAQDLAELLESTGLFPAHVVAHSYACGVAVRLAADRPELVRSLALHEPTYFGLLDEPERSTWMDNVPRMRNSIRDGRGELVARELVNYFASGEGGWERLPRDVRALALATIGLWRDEYADPEAVAPDPASLDEVWIPVLLTSGEDSRPALPQIAAELGRRLKNAVPRSIPGVGHFPHVTSPDRFVGILTTFLLDRIVPTV